MQQKFYALCAGLVTAAIYNVHRKKGARLLKPQDFVKERDEKVNVVSKKVFLSQLGVWASSHNKVINRKEQIQGPDS